MSTHARKAIVFCRHDPNVHEHCSDGAFCPLCGEGVCADCHRLWRETGNVTDTGDFEVGPACDCDNPVTLPYGPI